MILFAGHFILLQFIECNQHGTDHRGKILAFRRTQVQQHLFHLQPAGAHVVHDHQSADVFIRLSRGNIAARFADHDRGFQFKIQLLKMIGHANDITRPLYAVVVGKIKYGVLIKLGDHVHLAVAPCRGYVLPKGIAIPATGGVGNGRQQLRLIKRNGLYRSSQSILNPLLNRPGQGHHFLPIIQEHGHADREVGMEGFHGVNGPVDDHSELVGALV